MFTCRANIWWKHVRQLPFRIRCVDRPTELCEGLIGNQNSLPIDWAGEIRNRIQDERERERALNSTITEAVENIRRNRIVVVLFRVSSQSCTHTLTQQFHLFLSCLTLLSGKSNKKPRLIIIDQVLILRAHKHIHYTLYVCRALEYFTIHRAMVITREFYREKITQKCTFENLQLCSQSNCNHAVFYHWVDRTTYHNNWPRRMPEISRNKHGNSTKTNSQYSSAAR